MESLELCFMQVLILLLLLSANSSDFPPFYCPSNCGDLSIPYPFGISSGCFRPGFQLTCNITKNSYKLFVYEDNNYQITRLDNPVHASAAITVMPSNVKTLSISWSAPKDGPYFLSYENRLTVIGCGIDVQLMQRNESLGRCQTYCDSKESLAAVNGSSCHNTGCCEIVIPRPLNSYSFSLTRVGELNHLGKDYDVKAFILSDEYIFIEDDVYSNNMLTDGRTRANILLDWSIPSPQTCEDAQKISDTYACIAKYSYCSNSSTGSGYYCSCSSDDYTADPVPLRRSPNYRANNVTGQTAGNAYIPNGCEVVHSTNITHPKVGCQTKCGKIDVPFPFGLTQGCYRNPDFALFCNATTKPDPTLLFSYYTDVNNTYQVNEILIEEGQLQVDTTNDTLKARLKDAKPFFYNNKSGLFNWVIDYTTCDQAKKNKSTYACISHHSTCAPGQLGYHCKCSQGFEGNPYLDQGCQDVDECSYNETNSCIGHCINTVGSYICCHYQNTDDQSNALCISDIPNKQRTLRTGIFIGVGLGIGVVCLLIGIILIYCRRILDTRIQKKQRQEYFHQNRGLLLQQLISCNEDIAEKTKIFTCEELENATDKFDQSWIVGRGGHGTVFKGLLSDQRVVAIKKSKLTAKREIDQFINEVVILSRINHRNIVKLFRCCLETEVPLLVFEFISNGTLHDHLHDTDLRSTLSWEDRLRIASETAGALSYLHSAASISVFHRDVKSANILLDEYLTAKVSDFGASRSIPINQSQITTAVQGTYGYLDPEYHHTCQLTEKSDVYSFGVILAELLTGKLPVSFDRAEEERNLSVHFLQAIKGNSISEIVETRVKEESTMDQLGDFVRLAETCLSLKGEERPTMKDVEFKLQSLRMVGKQKKELHQTTEIKGKSSMSEASVSRDEISIPSEEQMISSFEKQSTSSPSNQP